MRSVTHKRGIQGFARSAWVLVCLCFIVVSLGLPAYAAQKSLPFYTMSTVNLASDVTLSDAQHASSMSQQHHAASVSSLPCDDPTCDNMPDCTDNCSMNTCCITSGVSSVLTTTSWALTGQSGQSSHHCLNRPSVLSVRSEPLFRPPIL